MDMLNKPAVERQRPGINRKTILPKADMTPMVDLGFLLISFFIFTAQLSQPKSMQLTMPKDGKPMPVAESASLCLLLGADNTVFYYHGKWTDAVKKNRLLETDYSASGIGQIIQEKQKWLDANPVKQEKREALMLIIKPGKNACYKNLIDVLDEALIYDVKKYVVVPATDEEEIFLKNN